MDSITNFALFTASPNNFSQSTPVRALAWTTATISRAFSGTVPSLSYVWGKVNEPGETSIKVDSLQKTIFKNDAFATPEILTNILSYLNLNQLKEVRKVDKYWHNVARQIAIDIPKKFINLIIENLDTVTEINKQLLEIKNSINKPLSSNEIQKFIDCIIDLLNCTNNTSLDNLSNNINPPEEFRVIFDILNAMRYPLRYPSTVFGTRLVFTTYDPQWGDTLEGLYRLCVKSIPNEQEVAFQVLERIQKIRTKIELERIYKDIVLDQITWTFINNRQYSNAIKLINAIDYSRITNTRIKSAINRDNLLSIQEKDSLKALILERNLIKS